MVDSISDFIQEFDFSEIHEIFLDSAYYDVLFPFLLIYALLSTVLPRLSLFQYKKTKKPIKPVTVIISLIVSVFGVSFEISEGIMVGDLLMKMLPNISALTMGILALYIVGSLMGQNFFKGLFRKDHSAYVYMTFGVIGLGSVMYYVGISMGFWDYEFLNHSSQWNFILAIGFLIMGVVFLFIDLVPFGILFLVVFAAFVLNSGEESFLGYFIDPVVFIVFIFIIMFSWLNSDSKAGKKAELEKSILDSEQSVKNYEKLYGRKPKDFESRIFDIIDHNLKSKKDKLKKLK